MLRISISLRFERAQGSDLRRRRHAFHRRSPTHRARRGRAPAAGFRAASRGPRAYPRGGRLRFRPFAALSRLRQGFWLLSFPSLSLRRDFDVAD